MSLLVGGQFRMLEQISQSAETHTKKENNRKFKCLGKLLGLSQCLDSMIALV